MEIRRLALKEKTSLVNNAYGSLPVCELDFDCEQAAEWVIVTGFGTWLACDAHKEEAAMEEEEE